MDMERKAQPTAWAPKVDEAVLGHSHRKAIKFSWTDKPKLR